MRTSSVNGHATARAVAEEMRILMPTFDNPQVDAQEAAEALRGLAHASRGVPPDQLYPVLGELLAGLRTLPQIVEQLAASHRSNTSRAADDSGDWPAGAHAVDAAVLYLESASTFLRQAENALDHASAETGRIAWQPEPNRQRWASVVFLQGDEADRVLELIERDGPDAAIDYLTGWDFGDETVSAALENGDVTDTPPGVGNDDLSIRDEYALVTNPGLRYVGLSRRFEVPEDIDDEPAVSVGRPPTPIAAASRAGAVGGASWFARPDARTESTGRGVGR